jgi:hypothetical protein
MVPTTPPWTANVGDHICNIYRTDTDQRAIAIDLVRDGIKLGHKVLYVVAAHTAAGLGETLRTSGIDVAGLVAKGQLVILTAKEAYLEGGEFKPERMIDLLRHEEQKALDAGYPALRLTGEMAWALAGEYGSELLTDYEAMLGDFYPNSKCYGICQYDRRLFDAEVLLEILYTHPKVMSDQRIYDNARMYFLPSERFLSRDRQSALLDQFLVNLAEHRVV